MNNYQITLNKSAIEWGLISFPKSIRHHFPLSGEQITIIDGRGESYPTTMHKTANRIDGLTKFHNDNGHKLGDILTLIIDPSKKGEVKILSSNIQNSSLLNEEDEEIFITPSLEKTLEDFISKNLNKIEPNLKLYEDNEVKGRQFPTDIGDIDLLCLDSENNFVVIELKKGSSSDVVVGQISRYIGWVQENLAKDKKVRGIIVVNRPSVKDTKENLKLNYAVAANSKIELRYYEISLSFLEKGKAI